MAILTLQERFNSSQAGKEALRSLKAQHIINQRAFQWDSKRPNLGVNDFISLDILYIDEDTQRDPFSPARVAKLRKIVQDPCAYHFNRIIVSERDWLDGPKKRVIVEGQGRALAAYCMGLQHVPCDVYKFASKEQEAIFFLEQGKNVHNIKNWERHRITIQRPSFKNHNQGLDVERVVTETGIEYEPSKIKDIDASAAYQGIRDSIISSQPNTKAGSRNCWLTIEITNLMIKYGSDNGKITLRSDLYYPLTEFVLSYKNQKQAMKRLEEKIISLKQKRGGSLTIDAMAEAMSLGLMKNMKEKKNCWKAIKRW